MKIILIIRQPDISAWRKHTIQFTSFVNRRRSKKTFYIIIFAFRFLSLSLFRLKNYKQAGIWVFKNSFEFIYLFRLLYRLYIIERSRVASSRFHIIMSFLFLFFPLSCWERYLFFQALLGFYLFLDSAFTFWLTFYSQYKYHWGMGWSIFWFYQLHSYFCI